MDQLSKGTHVASHGYVGGKNDLDFVEASHNAEKADSLLKGNGQPVWPSDDQLKEAPEIGYGHFAECDKDEGSRGRI